MNTACAAVLTVIACVPCTQCASLAPAAKGAGDSPATPATVPHLMLAEATPEAAPEPAAPAAREEDKSGRTARTLGWISVAVGAEAAVAAVATSFMMLHDKSVRDADCNAKKVCSADGYAANAALDALSWWNVGAYGIAAAGLGIGAVLLLANRADSSGRSMAIVVAPNAGGAGLSARGRF